MRVNDKTLALFLKLSNDPDFVDWLEEQKQRNLSNLVALVDPVMIHQTQGRVKELDTISHLMGVARKR